MQTLLLRNWPVLAKVGLTALVAVFGLGLHASLLHLVEHYQNRDGRPNLSRDDIVAAYAGLNAPPPLLAAIHGQHPAPQPPLSEPAHNALEKWLASDKAAENFDNMDFSDPTPREILASNCTRCHSAKADEATAGTARVKPLETWEQVKPFAFARRVERTPDRVKAISMHTHALSLGTMAAAIAVLAMLTTFPRGLTGALVGLMGLGLVADIGAWWLTNKYTWTVDLIIGGGIAFNGATALLLFCIAFDCWKPRQK
jgi:hypothetical protein